jgi:hypothetical protein
MTGEFQNFVAARLPFAGLAAWSARLPDRTVQQQCLVGGLTPGTVEQALARLALAAEGLQQQGVESARSCWVFEHLRLHLAVRRDGACLALFVENRPELPAAAAESVLTAFAELPN